MVEMGLYDASVRLSRIGVISGIDMTPEAAIIKMMYLLGHGYDQLQIKEQMQKNLRGEQSYDVLNLLYDYGETQNNVCALKNQDLPSKLSKKSIYKVSIRFEEVVISDTDKSPAEIKIFMNYPKANTSTPSTIPQCIGVIGNIDKETDFVIDCTERVCHIINADKPLQLTVVSCCGNISWEGVVFSIYLEV
jgi:L-asparaginase